MNLKEAVKDTNKKFEVVVSEIPRVFGDFFLMVVFILTLPAGYLVAVISRMVKK